CYCDHRDLHSFPTRRSSDLGVLAPNVRTREEAELLVRACKYPPRGVRSLGAGRFALSFKTDAPTYFQRANDELLVIAQIEHVDGDRKSTRLNSSHVEISYAV